MVFAMGQVRYTNAAALRPKRAIAIAMAINLTWWACAEGRESDLMEMGCATPTRCWVVKMPRRNYDENATQLDGSCVYAEEYYDCAGECLADADMDGVSTS